MDSASLQSMITSKQQTGQDTQPSSAAYPPHIYSTPKESNSLAKPIEEPSWSRSKAQNPLSPHTTNSLAIPKESMSVVVGGSKQYHQEQLEIRTPERRLGFPVGTADRSSYETLDNQNYNNTDSKGSRFLNKVLFSDKLSSVHSEDSEENYVAEYEIPK